MAPGGANYSVAEKQIGWLIRIASVLFVASLQIGTFYLTYKLYAAFSYTSYFDLETSLDQLIPYVNWSWIVYHFGFVYILLWGAAGIWPMSRRALLRTICIYSIMVLAGALIRSVIPSETPWQAVANLHQVQHGFKRALAIEPLACFPSMHVAMSVLPAFISSYVFKTRVTRILSVILAACVCASVVTAKEHWLIDIVGGLILGLVAGWTWKVFAYGPGIGISSQSPTARRSSAESAIGNMEQGR